MNELETMLLRDRLQVARERRQSSTPNSRSWERAGAEMDIVRARLAKIEGLAVGRTQS
jgi:hypothetical protein